MRSIRERPEEAQSREVPGHWEGDLIKGAFNGSAIGTLVDRSTRFVILAKVDDSSAEAVLEGFTRRLRTLPKVLRKTLTDDQGREMVETAPYPSWIVARLVLPEPCGLPHFWFGEDGQSYFQRSHFLRATPWNEWVFPHLHELFLWFPAFHPPACLFQWQKSQQGAARAFAPCRKHPVADLPHHPQVACRGLAAVWAAVLVLSVQG